MPVTKPSVYIQWTDGDPSKVVAPGPALALQGYLPNQPVAAQNLNWLFYTLDQWVKWLDQQTTFKASVPSTQKACLGVRLIDGGTWTWTLSSSNLAWASTMTLAYAGLPDSYNQVAAGSVTLADGQVAYVTANAPAFMAADVANGSANLLNVAYPADLAVGMVISGANIPANTTILSITSNTVGMSATATGSATQQTLAFATTTALSVSVAASSSLMANANTVVIARRSGSIVYVGAPGAEMAIRSAEKKSILGRGFDSVVTLTSFGAVTAGQVVQILTSGGNTGKVIPADVSVPGSGLYFLPIVGVAVTSGTNAAVDIVTSGVISTFSSLTPGLAIYADPATPGGVTQTAPTAIGSYVAPIGMALTANSAAIITQTLPPVVVPVPPRTVIGPFVWSFASIPASPTATTVNYQLGGFVYNNSGTIVGTTLGGAVSYDHGFVAPWAGDIVGVTAIGGANLGAGKTVSCFAYASTITSQVAPVTLSAASQSAKSTLAVGGGGAFGAGSIIRAGVNIPSGTTYTAPGMDFVVYVVVQFSA
jgi:hypothetical protein